MPQTPNWLSSAGGWMRSNPALIALFLAAAAGRLRADELSLPTYYPSPTGSYDRLSVSHRATLARDGGRVLIGPSDGADPASTLEIGAERPIMTIRSASDNQWLNPFLDARRARGTAASPAPVQDKDVLFELRSEGYDGSAWRTAASYETRIEGAVVPRASIPGALTLRTRPAGCAGAGCLRDRFYVGPDGRIGFGTSAPDTGALVTIDGGPKVHVLSLRGTAPLMRFRFDRPLPGFNGFEAGLRKLADGRESFNIRAYSDAGGSFPHFEILPDSTFYLGAVPRAMAAPPACSGAMRLQTDTGACLTVGGVWTPNSSRSLKRDIAFLGARDAAEAFKALEPVRFRYKKMPEEDVLGFIAEEAPPAVASKDRRALNAGAAAALLAEVVREQGRKLEIQAVELAELKARLDALEGR